MNQVAIEAIAGAEPMTPTIAARSLYLVHGAVYEAVAAFVDQPTGQVPSPVADATRTYYPDADLDAVVATAAYHALVSLFSDGSSESVAPFDQMLSDLGLAPTAPGVDTAEGVAASIAQGFLLDRQDDGSNAGVRYRNLTVATIDPAAPRPDVTATSWRPEIVPTGSATDGSGLAVVDPADAASYRATEFLTSHWGTIDPFALTSGDQFRPPSPPNGEGERSLVSELTDVVTTGSQLTDDQRAAAMAWSLGSDQAFSAGRWNQIAQDVSVRYRFGVLDDVLLFFTLNGALLDASIASTDAQVHYDLGRPVALVESVLHDDGWVPYRDPTLGSPASPGYVSDDAAYAAAAAEAIRQVTGGDELATSDVTPWDRDGDGADDPVGQWTVPGWTDPLDGTRREPVTLRWETLSAAATEAAQAQVWNGAAIRSAQEQGQALGRPGRGQRRRAGGRPLARPGDRVARRDHRAGDSVPAELYV